MCGICGFIRFDKGLIEEDPKTIQRMNAKLYHRGPDSQDTLLLENAAFGFSRLSIIGLNNGMQPILNEDKSIILICNGEIFNYEYLRQQLKRDGHTFRTDSDIEVIIHLYEEKGTDFLNQLNGQFSFALYDKNRKQLFCCRDQMGIAPFYYTTVKNTFIFGSEIKAILEHPLVKPEVDIVGLDQLFTFAGLISPRTMFKDIHSLENGHYLEVDHQGNMEKREYWDLIYPHKEIDLNVHSESYYIEKLEALFEESIRLRLKADVPVGLYLSGGLDSSMITMKANQLEPKLRKEVFSIDFVESQYSETPYQTLIAEKSNSILNKKTFYFTDISKRLPQVIYHSECPLKETYNTASHSLSESTNAKGIKVILSGEGSDELFAGYVGYRFDMMRAQNIVQNYTTPKERELRNKIWGDEIFFYEADFLNFNKIKRDVYSEHINASFEEFDCLNHFVVDKNKLRNRNLINKRSYIDYKLRLVDHLVSDHGDRMALANSVEVRYPFLDKDLVEFSTQIPCELKLNALNEKYILKRMASKFVPQSVIDREKFGFVAPGSPYLLKNNVEYINDILSSESINKQGYFNVDQIEKLKRMYKNEDFVLNVPFETDLLILVITFGIFKDTFF